MIYIEHKRSKLERLQKKYPNAVILDVTSTSPNLSARLLSPFYPHGGIPVPYSDGYTAYSVEGIWQGLKVFESSDVDFETLQNSTMHKIKRTVRKYGKPLGHRKGISGDELLDYREARYKIYVPTYKWVLDNVLSVHNIIDNIREESKKRDIVLLDYNTNPDCDNLKKPISHASLIKAYVEGRYPTEDKPSPTDKQDAAKNVSSISGLLFDPDEF